MTLPAPLVPLAAYNQWITWRLEPDPDRPGKMAKRPCHARTGWRTKLTDPLNWVDYETALAGAPLADAGWGSGVGFVLTEQDPFWFLDADKQVGADGQWSPLVHALSARLAGAGVEVSQSGTGIHWIGSGTIPPHGCRNGAAGLELYHRDRFIALTGAQAAGDVRTDATVAIGAIVAEYFPPAPGGDPVGPGGDGWTDEPVEAWSGPDDDAELVRRILKSRSGAAASFGTTATFKQLWTADTAALASAYPGDDGTGYNASSADQALFMHFAWWTGRNCARVLRIASQSALARDKWKRKDYIERSIIKVCASGTDCYSEGPSAVIPPAEPMVVRGPVRAERPRTGDPKDKNDHALIMEWLWVNGWDVRYDEFRDRIVLDDDTVLTDNIERQAWLNIRETSMLKFGKDFFGEALRQRAWERRFHPVRDYLDSMQPTWDGTPRIDTWLRDYAGAPDTAYVRAIGRLFMLAAVRRVRSPGAKFDELLVLEGPQGRGKSTLFEALCPDPTWFTDNISLAMSTKEVMEAMQGKWIIEAPELSKLSDAGVEHVKAMLSRRVDKARLAYARNATEAGRQCVWGGTVNADAYLRDKTGNRRFWPARCGTLRVAWVAAARDQLWAEAAHREAAGESIRLDEALWGAAAAEQEERMVDDPLETLLGTILGERTGRVKPKVLWDMLCIPVDRQTRLNRAFGEAMKSLGWEKKRISVMTEKVWYYIKGGEAREIIYIMGDLKYAEPILRTVET